MNDQNQSHKLNDMSEDKSEDKSVDTDKGAIAAKILIGLILGFVISLVLFRHVAELCESKWACYSLLILPMIITPLWSVFHFQGILNLIGSYNKHYLR